MERRCFSGTLAAGPSVAMVASVVVVDSLLFVVEQLVLVPFPEELVSLQGHLGQDWLSHVVVVVLCRTLQSVVRA